MFYELSKDFFKESPDAIFGVVAVRGLDNRRKPIAELGDTISLKYELPVGAYDIYTFVRPDGSGRGTDDAGLELIPEQGAGQKEQHRITEETTGALFQIDGFAGTNRDSVEKALKDFVELIANYYVKSGSSCSVATGVLDKDNRRFEF